MLKLDEATSTKKEKLIRDALEHCLFSLVPMEEIHREGPNIYVQGHGVELIDLNGTTYIDMVSSGTRANSLGYGNQEIAQAVYDQLSVLHYVGTVANIAEPTIRLATKLSELTPGRLSKSVFVSGGSEAVETAIKIARHYHINHGSKPRAYKIISRWNAYHGITMGALAATDWLGVRSLSEPSTPGYSRIPAPICYRNQFGMDDESYGFFCAEYLEQQIQHEGPESVAAFIAEPIMQANGVQIPPPGYLQRVREICDKYEVLFIADEVITGFGRTGDWFALNHFGVEADIMTIAKSLTAGYLPMGTAITRKEIAETIPTFRHVHTFSGHPAAAAAANTSIAIYERDNLIARAKENGAYFLDVLKKELEKHPIVGQVRGLGLWLAVDFTADKKTKAPFTDDTVKAVVSRMKELGVLVTAIGTAFELAPPMITERTELDRTVTVAAQAIQEVAKIRNLV